MNECETLNKIDWVRSKGGFDKVLGKYILRKTFELMSGPTVLDIGCGDGSLTKELASHYDKVIGVDGSVDKINIARQNAPDVEFHVSLFEEFEYDMKFDSIIMINVLEHVNYPILFLKRAKDFLKSSGEIIIFVPNALSLNKRIGKLMGLIESCYELKINDLRVGHKRLYDMKSLINDLETSGLKVDRSGGVFLKPLSNNQMESWSGKICDAFYEIAEELPDYSSPIYARVI